MILLVDILLWKQRTKKVKLEPLNPMVQPGQEGKVSLIDSITLLSEPHKRKWRTMRGSFCRGLFSGRLHLLVECIDLPRHLLLCSILRCSQPLQLLLQTITCMLAKVRLAVPIPPCQCSVCCCTLYYKYTMYNYLQARDPHGPTQEM